MADQMTTTGSVGGGRKDPVPADAVAQKFDELRQAMIDAGEDPGQVDAKLSMVKPPTPSIVGNYADLQRMGAIAQTGVMPTPPGEDDLVTNNLTDAFVELPAQGDEADQPTTTDGANQAAADTPDNDTRTKADLQAELDAKGVEYPSTATKADLVALLEG